MACMSPRWRSRPRLAAANERWFV